MKLMQKEKLMKFGETLKELLNKNINDLFVSYTYL
jgi:hypothetical protein